MSDSTGLFGGTFDPVHRGHISIVNSFLDSDLIDELWIIPAPTPPHKTDEEITPFGHRKKMLELAFAGVEQVWITDIEERLPAPSYTVHTIQYLKQKYPGKIFYLCIGEDSLADFSSWYKPERIVQECELLVAERPEIDARGVNNVFLKNAHFVKHDPVDISSTDIRVKLRNNGEELSEQVPPKVLEYIKENGLYRE